MLLPAIVGIVLALAVSAYAMAIGLDRDRAFYPTVMIVIASYYVLFAVMAGAGRAMIVEACVAGVFMIIATMGFTRNSWLVVAALAAHGILDLVHGSIVSNPGVPTWWPSFCLTYDVTAAAFLAWTLRFRLPVEAE